MVLRIVLLISAAAANVIVQDSLTSVTTTNDAQLSSLLGRFLNLNLLIDAQEGSALESEELQTVNLPIDAQEKSELKPEEFQTLNITFDAQEKRLKSSLEPEKFHTLNITFDAQEKRLKSPLEPEEFHTLNITFDAQDKRLKSSLEPEEFQTVNLPVEEHEKITLKPEEFQTVNLPIDAQEKIALKPEEFQTLNITFDAQEKRLESSFEPEEFQTLNITFDSQEKRLKSSLEPEEFHTLNITFDAQEKRLKSSFEPAEFQTVNLPIDEHEKSTLNTEEFQTVNIPIDSQEKSILNTEEYHYNDEDYIVNLSEDLLAEEFQTVNLPIEEHEKSILKAEEKSTLNTEEYHYNDEDYIVNLSEDLLAEEFQTVNLPIDAQEKSALNPEESNRSLNATADEGDDILGLFQLHTVNTLDFKRKQKPAKDVKTGNKSKSPGNKSEKSKNKKKKNKNKKNKKEKPGNKSECSCGVRNNQRIVNGEDAGEFSWPWISRLSVKYDSGTYQCGGSLIADQWILTATHCAAPEGGKLPTIKVYLGDHDKRRGEDDTNEIVIPVSKIINHASYGYSDNGAPLNDITLLKLKRKVDMRTYTPVCLPTSNSSYDGQNPWVYGWGTTLYGGDTPNILQEATVQVVTNEACSAQGYGASITSEQICAYTEGVDACQGDSGGPLSYDNNCKHEQIGVVSYGYGCAKKNFSGVYTRVTEYLDWIEEQISANGGATYCNK